MLAGARRDIGSAQLQSQAVVLIRPADIRDYAAQEQEIRCCGWREVDIPNLSPAKGAVDAGLVPEAPVILEGVEAQGEDAGGVVLRIGRRRLLVPLDGKGVAGVVQVERPEQEFEGLLVGVLSLLICHRGYVTTAVPVQPPSEAGGRASHQTAGVPDDEPVVAATPGRKRDARLARPAGVLGQLRGGGAVVHLGELVVRAVREVGI